MKVIEILKKLNKQLSSKTLLSAHPIEEDEEFLFSIKEPQNDVERSFAQYVCQKWNDRTQIKYLVYNFVSLMLFLPYFIKFCFFSKKSFSVCYDAVLTIKGLEEYVPDDFQGTLTIPNFDAGSLNNQDRQFLFNVWKAHPFSLYFNFKIMCRVAAYSDMIYQYSPKIVFSSAEYSFTSSILTSYCNSLGIRHYNIMHGEKLLNIREAFARFDRFYVWNSYYISLLTSLRTIENQYVVFQPKRKNIKTLSNNQKCVYYLQLHTKKELLRIKEALIALGIEYMVRPHPLHYNSTIKKIFGENKIQDPLKTDIWSSIANAGIAVSQYSTVLYHASVEGVAIIVDDVSNPALYSCLINRKYIVLSNPHLLLSEEIRKREVGIKA